MKIKSFITRTKKVEDVVPEITTEEATSDIIENPTQDMPEDVIISEPETIEPKEIESIEVDSIVPEENGDMTIIKGEEQFIVPAEAIVNPKPEVVEQVMKADIAIEPAANVIEPIEVPEVSEKPIVEPEFDEAKYLAAYPDVAEAVRYGRIISGYDHYVRFGKAEGR